MGVGLSTAPPSLSLSLSGACPLSLPPTPPSLLIRPVVIDKPVTDTAGPGSGLRCGFICASLTCFHVSSDWSFISLCSLQGCSTFPGKTKTIWDRSICTNPNSSQSGKMFVLLILTFPVRQSSLRKRNQTKTFMVDKIYGCSRVLEQSFLFITLFFIVLACLIIFSFCGLNFDVMFKQRREHLCRHLVVAAESAQSPPHTMTYSTSSGFYWLYWDRTSGDFLME